MWSWPCSLSADSVQLGPQCWNMPSTLRAQLWVASLVNEQVGTQRQDSPPTSACAAGLEFCRLWGFLLLPQSLPANVSAPRPHSPFLQDRLLTHLHWGPKPTNSTNGTLASTPRLLKASQVLQAVLYLQGTSVKLQDARMDWETWGPEEGQLFF